MYGIFILRHGEWLLHGTFKHKGDALQECAYLTRSLGLTVKLFKKD